MRLLPSKDIVSVREISTPYGDGTEADVKVGNEIKKCSRIKDKETGNIVYLGDPRACKILDQNLQMTGIEAEASEKLKTQEG